MTEPNQATDPSEDRLTADCYQWFHNSFIALRGLLWHIPNGGRRNLHEANKFKAMGVVRGIFDFHFLYHGTLYEIEMKVPPNTLTDDQTKIRMLHTEHGAITYICFTFEQFKLIILNILNNVSNRGK